MLNCWGYIASIIDEGMSIKGLVGWYWTGKMEVMSDKHITVPYFYNKFHTDWTGNEPGLSWWITNDIGQYLMYLCVIWSITYLLIELVWGL